MFDSNWDADQAVYLVIVLGAIAAIVVYLVRAFRRQGQKPWPAFFVGLYNILLLLLYLFGMMTQATSEGFGFFPLIALTLPSTNDQGTHFMALVLEDKEKDRQQMLRPMATYEAVKFPIYLDDSSQIKLSVEQDEGNPVIRVDQSGTVHALREGKAVLVGDFDGVQDRIQVTVYSKEDAPVGYRTVIP